MRILRPGLMLRARTRVIGLVKAGIFVGLRSSREITEEILVCVGDSVVVVARGVCFVVEAWSL